MAPSSSQGTYNRNQTTDSQDTVSQAMDNQSITTASPMDSLQHSLPTSEPRQWDSQSTANQQHKSTDDSFLFTINLSYHFFFVPFFFSSWCGVELLTTVGLPKKDSSRACVPLLLFSFFTAPSILDSAKPFSSTRNFLSAYSSIFFSHFNSYSSVTFGFLNSSLASSKEKSSSLGRTNFIFPSFSFSFLQKSRMFSIDPNSLMNLQALTGPIPSILEAQSQPERMHISMNSSSVSPKSSIILARLISVRGSFLWLRSRTMMEAPKTKQSVSSVQTASTLPFLHMQLHCASASPGAWITGIPISLSMCITSSLSFLVIQVVLCCCFSASAKLPTSSASSFFSVASSFIFLLLSNSPFFLVGALPSNTQIGLIPFSISRSVLLKRPSKWPVLLPSASVREVRKLESAEMPWVETRNWYMDMEASRARDMPEKYLMSRFLMESGEFARSRSISL